MATLQAAKPERTIVVCGVPDGLLNDDIMADILMIHFQKAKNKGGDVEGIVYPTSTKGVAYITFEDERVAENVLKKGEHGLEDKRLHRDYPLKVSSYGKSIFTCITCVLNLSPLGEKYSLEDVVQDLKKNLPNLSFGPLHPTGQIRVQGPFLAMSRLQNSILLKIKHSLSEQHVTRKQRRPDHRPSLKWVSDGLSSELRNNFVQNPNKEGLIVALDTDTYRYMKKFKDKLYQDCLEKCGVISYASVDGDITTIYLDSDNTRPGPSQLEQAKNLVESLLAELYCFLRKERLSQEGSNRTEKRKCERACEIVSSQYPNILIIPYSTHIDIIGSSSDVYEFATQVNKMVGNFQKEAWR
ncbi:RNA-binding protein 43 isoform X2 [Rhineura floridana]|uniref:RNA-binding protein 43 isoform X2 n=1 Tax=Rhineura floridana TaxID=261503 RepID=UPI002AC81748|nr:RNA-binding protein 43 isoform X2 [Rhineura floridana]